MIRTVPIGSATDPAEYFKPMLKTIPEYFRICAESLEIDPKKQWQNMPLESRDTERRLKQIEMDVVRIGNMIEKLYELRYHNAPPRRKA